MKKVVFGVVFGIAMLIVGCSNPASAYYNSQRVYDFGGMAIGALYLDSTSIEDKKLTQVILGEMKAQGFDIVGENAPFECGLFASSQEPTYTYQSSITTYNNVISNTNTSGFVGGNYVFGNSTTTTSVPTQIPIETRVTFKKVYVDIYCKGGEDKVEKVFEGFASVDLPYYFDPEKRRLFIRNLVVSMSHPSFRGNYLIEKKD